MNIFKPKWLLLVSILSMLTPAANAFGASYQWLDLKDRERLVINLDSGDSAGATLSRVAPNGLLLNLKSAPNGLTSSGAAPTPNSILSSVTPVQPGGNTINISTNTPAFGYFFFRHTPNQVVVEVFKDETGARWKAQDDAQANSGGGNDNGQSGVMSVIRPAVAQAAAAPVQPAVQQAAPQPTAPQQQTVQTAQSFAPQAAAQPVQQPVQQFGQPLDQAAGQFMGQVNQMVQPGQPAVQPAQNFAPQMTAQQMPMQAVPGQMPIQMQGQMQPQQFQQMPLQGQPMQGQAAGQYVQPMAQPYMVDQFGQPMVPQQAWSGMPAQQAMPQQQYYQQQPMMQQPGFAAPQQQVQQGMPMQAMPAQVAQPAPQAVQQVPQAASAPSAVPGAVSGASPSGPSLSVPIHLGDLASVPAPQPVQQPLQQPVPQAVTGQPMVQQANPMAVAQPAMQQPMQPLQQQVQQPPVQAQPQMQAMPQQQPQAVSPVPQTQQVQQFQQGQQQAAPLAPAPRELELLVKSNSSAPAPAPGAPAAEHGGEKAPPPPPSPEQLILEVQRHLAAREYEAAQPILEGLRDSVELTNEQREGVLHDLATVIYELGKNDIAANYQKIIASTTEAMNFNLKSPKVAVSLMRLGFVNLRTNNVQEAEAYFNILKKQFPKDENIPLIYYNWGEYYYGKKDFQRAADEYQYVVQNFPDNQHVRDAAVALARTYYNLGYYDEAFRVVDFIERRWPRFYLEQPRFLNMLGDLAFRVGKNARARNYYWTYYNIMPDGDEADMVLARLGDIYALDGQVDAAREAYNEAYRNFPDRDGGLVAMMRLAEEGIYDAPTVSEMSTIFDNRQYSLSAVQAYNKILNEFPNSNLAPLARLKLAMWHLWNKEYEQALKETSTFAKDYPKSTLLPKVREVAMQAFDRAVADGVLENRSGIATALWDKFPIVREQLTEMQPQSKIALAASLWKSGQPQRALDTLEPFFKGAKMPEYGDEALALALNVLTENDKWQGIKDLNEKVELWELADKPRQHLDFAVAMAEEKTGNTEAAAAIWKKLQGDTDLHPMEQAYAQYFTAVDAWKKRDLETAYRVGRESLRNFLSIAERDPTRIDQPKIKLLLNMLMDIAESSGRYKEALDYLNKYPQYLEAADNDKLANLYREARLYNKMGDLPRWQSILQNLADNYPNDIYGRLAASELRSYKISEEAARFTTSTPGL